MDRDARERSPAGGKGHTEDEQASEQPKDDAAPGHVIDETA